MNEIWFWECFTGMGRREIFVSRKLECWELTLIIISPFSFVIELIRIVESVVVFGQVWNKPRLLSASFQSKRDLENSKNEYAKRSRPYIFGCTIIKEMLNSSLVGLQIQRITLLPVYWLCYDLIGQVRLASARLGRQCCFQPILNLSNKHASAILAGTKKQSRSCLQPTHASIHPEKKR